MNSKQVFGMGAHPLTLDNGALVGDGLGGDVGLMRVLRVFERAQVHLANIWQAYACREFASGLGDPQESSAVLWVRLGPVLRIQNSRNITQIADAVVKTVAVLMVDLGRRPFAMNKSPSEAMGGVVDAEHFYAQVALLGHGPCGATRLDATVPLRHSGPSKSPGVRAVAQKVLQSLDVIHDLATNQANERGRHETGIRCDVSARCADGLNGVRSSHRGLPSGAVPVDSLQRGARNRLWISSATAACGRKTPPTDVVCAAALRAVHAESGERFAIWVFANSSTSIFSIRSNCVIAFAVGLFSCSHPMGSIFGSTMAHLLGGLGFAGGGCIQIAASKRLAMSGTEEHHAGVWNAVTLPIADARHGETEHA